MSEQQKKWPVEWVSDKVIKPDPKAVRQSFDERIEQLRAATGAAIEEAKKAYQQTAAQLAEEQERRIDTESEALEQGLEESDQRIENQEQAVADADAEIARLEALLRQAKAKKKEEKANLKEVNRTEARTKKELTAEFNVKAGEIRHEIGRQNAAAWQEVQQVVDNANAQIDALAEEGRAAVKEEKRDLFEYRVTVVKDEILSDLHGVQQVFSTLGEAFRRGRDAPSGVELPEHLQARVRQTTANDNDSAPEAEDKKNGTQGPDFQP